MSNHIPPEVSRIPKAVCYNPQFKRLPKCRATGHKDVILG
jgi:hypothetical protein